MVPYLLMVFIKFLSIRSLHYVMKKETGGRRIMLPFGSANYVREVCGCL